MKKYGFKRLLFLCFLCFTSIAILAAEVPAGYYNNARNKQKDALKTALHELAKPLQVLRYGGGTGYTWEGFFYTDQHQDGSVIDMYSPIVRYFDGFKSVSGMHIEHSFPKSWWGGHEWPVYKDLFHLYPSDGSINMSKSNNPLGVVTGTPTSDNGVSKVGPATYTGYTGNVFEPADEFKGDFARSYFYVVTVYEDLAPYWNSPMLNNNTYPVWKPWAIELLKQWHQQDPVSIKEELRQEKVYKIQGNRNPFIDYPDLVNYIWGNDTLSNYPFPDETVPFLVSPKLGDKINFGVILQSDKLSKFIFVQGANITSDLNLSLKRNNPGFELKSLTLSKQNTLSGAEIELSFSPTTSGSFIDTLVIQGGGLAQPRMVPISGKASKDFMVLEADEHTPVGAKLTWIAEPQAIDYQLTVFQGATKAGNLLFSSYVEGSGYNKAVELYNGTGKTLDLSNYLLMKQSDGVGDFKAPNRLSGTLENNRTFLVTLNNSQNELEDIADAVFDSE
ncbi:MAG: endonuclease, partial [Paludibacter sp.]|nr:endonuclease [Paludibacter sp.]